MRRLFAAVAALVVVAGAAAAEEPGKVVLTSPDGKKTYDLAELTAKGPVLVRLTCACSGCDAEVVHFKKLQAAYNGKGLRTLAVFREKPEAASDYTAKKGLNFLWLADPKGSAWKTFKAKSMPTNILIDKGGKVVKVVAGCKPNGENAQILSAEVAKLLKTEEVKIVAVKQDSNK